MTHRTDAYAPVYALGLDRNIERAQRIMSSITAYVKDNVHAEPGRVTARDLRRSKALVLALEVLVNDLEIPDLETLDL